MRSLAITLVTGSLATGGALAALPSGNLLENGSGQNPLSTGWTVIENGGNGWGHSSGGGFDSTPGFFITSYGWCRRSQTIDLIAAGATEAELDAQPLIRVGEVISSYAGNGGGNDRYFIRVELHDADHNVIAAWDAGTQAAPLTATAGWTEHQYDFENYGPGVRYIYFEDGGIDTGFWAGHYGTYHDAASVEFFADTDSDGLPDAWEIAYGTNVEVPDADDDPDDDFLTNMEEYRLGTDPLNPDTDEDGLLDGDESNTGYWFSETNTGTDPLNPDTDGDGLLDGVENPELPYVDANQPGTDPNVADTDIDGFSDYAEILAGSDPTDFDSVPVFHYTQIMAENFDDISVNSTYHFTTSAGGHTAGIEVSGTSFQNSARLTSELHGSSSTSIAWDHVNAKATSVQLSFDFRMSADSGGEAADGFGIGLFKTSTYGTTGPVNPGLGAEWETPGAGNGMPDAVHFGFDIYSGATEGNNLRVSGPTNPKVVLKNVIVPRQLNSNQFHRAIITAIASGSSTLFNVDLIMDVDGIPESIQAIRGLIVPGFNLMADDFRIIAGGRTGGVTVRTDIDNVTLSATDVIAPPERIAITSVNRVADSLVIAWKSEPGKHYIVSRSEDLIEWEDIVEPVPSGGSTTTYQEAVNPVPGTQFFRIREAP
jgi:hypothetical protein